MHVVRVERQAVLALEVLADLVDVKLQAVLRVAVVKELQEPLRLLVGLLSRGARRACLGHRPVRRPHAGVQDLAPRLVGDGRMFVPPLPVCVCERLIFLFYFSKRI